MVILLDGKGIFHIRIVEIVLEPLLRFLDLLLHSRGLVRFSFKSLDFFLDLGFPHRFVHGVAGICYTI